MSSQERAEDSTPNGSGGNLYSVSFVTHEDIVSHSSLFWDTLRSFHYEMGTKLSIPVIGGKQLNLYVLYVEVTRRGGYHKVVMDKKWREVSSVFNFSPTTTSASYVLRKHYYNILRKYERAYFLKGPPLNATASIPVSDLSNLQQTADARRNASNPPIGAPILAVGTINAKFDCGYLVSVKMGSETLSGVLYHPGQPSSYTPIRTSNTTASQTLITNKAARKKKRKRGGEPGRPKPNRSGYNFFFSEKHALFKSLYPDREREFTKMIGESWSSLSLEEKEVYQKLGIKDKERYKKEMKEYKERMGAVQQRPQVVVEAGRADNGGP
ncbi:hypothetical protein AAG906_030155 [Vitis piasezkii]|uniref:High mobility group B protein 9 n=1 Tax=Vitis vinifera TaxID=29760 RepID=A0A438ETE6_VITVI|nr:high mobility group B protein 9 [Vitis riparia]RVW51044.1 High mobility group B protein 9 [Vitis vinifera]